MVDFSNKSIISKESSNSTTTITPISQRISPDLYACFSNLNFAGIYRIGSGIDKSLCYIGGSDNLTLKITHHMNLLYRGEHHSKGLQDWVNANGIENVDISVLIQCKNNPSLIENWEQYYLNVLKPKFNTVLNKKYITYEVRQYSPLRYANVKTLNAFGNPIVKPRKKDILYDEVVFTNTTLADEERKTWTPTICINTEDKFSITRGDRTNIKKVKPVENVVITYVVRPAFFSKNNNI
jgi:hypothetical protein